MHILKFSSYILDTGRNQPKTLLPNTVNKFVPPDENFGQSQLPLFNAVMIIGKRLIKT